MTHAIDETDYATASAAYGLEDWTSATRDVARLLRKAVPNGNEHPFFLQAVCLSWHSTSGPRTRR